MNWSKPVSIPLWIWEFYWGVGFIGAAASGNIIGIFLAGFLMAIPFYSK